MTPDRLSAMALLYLALPNFIFFFGWLELPMAFGCGILLSGLLSVALPWTKLGNSRDNNNRASRQLLLAVSLVWTACGGAGHLSFANQDWALRDAIVGDLIWGDWPVSYGLQDGSHLLLRSAFGYFLPTALIGKVLGIGAANTALFVWTALGTLIFLRLLPIQRKNPWETAFLATVVVFFSGMDFLGIILTTGTLPVFPLRLEWWVPYSYPSLSGQLFWAPNHALPLWLVSALFLRHYRHALFPRFVLALMPTLPLWTPFALIGALPLLLLAAWHHRHMIATFNRKEQTISLASLLLVLGLVRYLSFDIADIPAGLTSIDDDVTGTTGFLQGYLAFAAMEFGILSLLLYARLRKGRKLLLLSTVVLLALPFLRFGPSNDLLLRASTPPLIVLLYLTLNDLTHWLDDKKASFPWLVAAVLLIGGATPFNEIWRARMWPIGAADYQHTLVEKIRHMPHHYIGRLRDSDLIWVLKPPAVVPGYDQRR